MPLKPQGPGVGGSAGYVPKPVDYGDILTSFGQGALQGPGNAVASIPAGVSGLWRLISAIPYAKDRKEMVDTWTAMSPQDKQRVMDGVGEAMGAGVGAPLGGASGAAGGAFAFGLGAIPGAVAGSAAGAGTGGVVGHFVSRLIGHYTNPHGSDGYTASQNAHDIGSALTGNAFLEGAARVPGLLADTARIPATPEAARVAAIAKTEGIPQSLGVATGSPTVQKVEAALSRHPFSSGTMLAAKQKAQAAFEQSMGRFMDQYSQGAVGPEAFHDAVNQAMTDARASLQGGVDSNVAAAQRQFGPMRTATQAGQDLQAAHLDNAAMLKDWASKQYPALYEEANKAGVSVDPQAFSDEAGKMLDAIPGENQGFFPASAMNRLRQASNMREGITVDAPGGTITSRATANPMLLQEAVELRSQLYDAMRRMPYTAPAKDREVIGALASKMSDAIDNSVKTDNPDIYAKWRLLSDQFKQGTNAVKEPVAAGKPGNPMARTIRNSANPEALPGKVADNPSAVAQANLATDPSTITGITDPTMNAVAPRPAMDSVRGNVLNDIVAKNRFANGGRVSPGDLNDALTNPADTDRLNALFGGRTNDLQQAMADAAPTEDALYDSKLGRTLDGPNGDSSSAVRSSAFPRHNAPAATDTLNLFPVGPSQPGNAFGRGVAARGYMEGLADDSTRMGPVNRNTGQGVAPVLDPSVMTKKVADAGETVPAVLGDDGAAKLGDILEAGRSTFSPDLIYGNSSGTAQMREMFNTAGRVGKAIVQAPVHPIDSAKTLATTGAGILGAQLAARAVNSPAVVNWATSSPVAVAVSKPAAIARIFEGASGGKKPAPLASDDFIDDGDSDFIHDDEMLPAVPAGRKQPPRTPARNDDFIYDDPAVPAGRYRP